MRMGFLTIEALRPDAVSNWLLVYAHDREELGVMCRGLARRIKTGGRFVTLTTNPELYTWQSHPPDYRKYGFETRLPESAYEGAPVVITLHLDDESIVIENYYLPIAAYESSKWRVVTLRVRMLSISRAGKDGSHKNFAKRARQRLLASTFPKK